MVWLCAPHPPVNTWFRNHFRVPPPQIGEVNPIKPFIWFKQLGNWNLVEVSGEPNFVPRFVNPNIGHNLRPINPNIGTVMTVPLKYCTKSWQYCTKSSQSQPGFWLVSVNLSTDLGCLFTRSQILVQFWVSRTLLHVVYCFESVRTVHVPYSKSTDTCIKLCHERVVCSRVNHN